MTDEEKLNQHTEVYDLKGDMRNHPDYAQLMRAMGFIFGDRKTKMTKEEALAKYESDMVNYNKEVEALPKRYKDLVDAFNRIEGLIEDHRVFLGNVTDVLEESKGNEFESAIKDILVYLSMSDDSYLYSELETLEEIRLKEFPDLKYPKSPRYPWEFVPSLLKPGRGPVFGDMKEYPFYSCSEQFKYESPKE